MADARPRDVESAAERLAGSSGALPLAAFVAADGTGRTETLDALTEILDARGVTTVRIAGRRDRGVDFAALATDGSVIVVDDATLLDGASRDSLRALVDGAPGAGLGVVVAVAPSRDDPVTGAIARAGTVVRGEPADETAVAARAER